MYETSTIFNVHAVLHFADKSSVCTIHLVYKMNTLSYWLKNTLRFVLILVSTNHKVYNEPLLINFIRYKNEHSFIFLNYTNGSKCRRVGGLVPLLFGYVCGNFLISCSLLIKIQVLFRLEEIIVSKYFSNLGLLAYSEDSLVSSDLSDSVGLPYLSDSLWLRRGVISGLDVTNLTHNVRLRRTPYSQ